MKIKHCIIPLFLLLLTSCIKEVDFNQESLPKKVVVNGIICPDSSFSVRITLSSGMNENKQLIDDATIAVYEDGIFLYNLPPAGNGWYKVFATPSEGRTYRIEVTLQGFEMIYAETTIPVFPTVINAWYEKTGIADAHNQYEAITTIVFQDDPATPNFYQPGKNRYLYEQTKETDESILTESDLNYNPAYYYFSDALFNGQEKTLTLRGGGNIFHLVGQIHFQQDYEHLFSIVSEEYFRGIKTWTLHKYNQSTDYAVNDPLTLLFLGDPIEMYSNVIGGYGVFAGYNSKSIPVPPHE